MYDSDGIPSRRRVKNPPAAQQGGFLINYSCFFHCLLDRGHISIKGFWDFLFDEKLRETREILSKKRSNAEPGKKEKSLKNVVFSRLLMAERKGFVLA